MATQSNLDYQTFWAPRPPPRPRRVESQAHSRSTVPQAKPSPSPLNDNRGMIGVPKKSLDSSPRSASDGDDFIYISDDAASDIDDASHDPFDETLPSAQAIVQHGCSGNHTKKVYLNWGLPMITDFCKGDPASNRQRDLMIKITQA